MVSTNVARLPALAFEALDAHACLLDEHGTIVLVNSLWEQFARENGATELSRVGVGVSYLEVCDGAAAAGDAYAQSVAIGLRAVLTGKHRRFELEYPCSSPDEERYFLLTATPLREQERIVGALIIHQNVSQFKFELQDTASLVAYYQSIVEGTVPRTRLLLGNQPLRYRNPEVFLRLVNEYRLLVPRFLESRVLHIAPPRRELSAIAWQLGECWAGPRDVIDLHVESMDLRDNESLSPRRQFVLADGRLMALELMGYLVDYYRHPARQQIREEG